MALVESCVTESLKFQQDGLAVLDTKSWPNFAHDGHEIDFSMDLHTGHVNMWACKQQRYLRPIWRPRKPFVLAHAPPLSTKPNTLQIS